MSKEVLTWEGLDKLVQIAANKVLTLDVDNIYGVPRGGIIPAIMLSYKTGLPIVKKPTRNTLIVDDICDSGDTLRDITRQTMVSGWKAYLFMSDAPYRTLTLYKRYSATFSPDVVINYLHDDRWIVFPWESIDDPTERDGTNITI